MAPPDHTVCAPTSTLCKAVAFSKEVDVDSALHMLLHQCDWIAYLLHREMGYTDWNNALKLGYDPEIEDYPGWLRDSQPLFSLLPNKVLAPGEPVSRIDPQIAASYGISDSCLICSGTTDSIAAFLASGVSRPGQAVTSLGSTMAIKLLSKVRVDSAKYGIYSHKLGSSWLVGGASNTGGAVLRQFFSDEDLRALTLAMIPEVHTHLDYIVLPSKGERFPHNDPDLEPRLSPRPEDDAVFLQGMLESMARTEAEAYTRLTSLGSTPVSEVLTAGGGSANPVWTILRERAIGVPVRPAQNGEASYGAALLAAGATSSAPSM